MARIIGTGSYAPGEPIGHPELMRLTGLEFDAERTSSKLGIEQRHCAHLRGLDETTADFASAAAKAAVEDAMTADPALTMDAVGLFVVGTDTPEFISPATAILVQGRLQARQMRTAAFDINATCASFCTALHSAAAMVDGDPQLNYAVVVGAYNMPAYTRPGDAFGYSIFADGAGALVLAKGGPGYIAGEFVADGTQWDYVGVYAGGTRRPVTVERLEAGEYGLQLLKRLPGDRNVRLWPPVVHALLDKAGCTLAEVEHFIFTQINKEVIRQVMELLGRPMEDTTTIMERYGYTGSACIPMALHEARSQGRIGEGSLVMLVASGAGLAVAANLVRL